MVLKLLCHGIYIELNSKVLGVEYHGTIIVLVQYTMKVLRYHIQKHGSTLKLYVGIIRAAVV